MDKLRMEYLWDAWNAETQDPETQEWRDELAPEELETVSQWDGGYEHGILALCSAILLRELIRQKFGPLEVQEIADLPGCCCRLKLRDGRTFLARLGRDNSLRLDEPDGAC